MEISPTSRPKILIVDDYPENLLTLQKILRVLDVDVLQASTGNEALGLALEHEFFSAILDVQMPEMDGYELAELLRGNPTTATLPIIFVSAVFSDEYNHRKGYEAGAVDFISKPFVPEIFLSKIKVFLDLYLQRHALETFVEQLNRANRQLELVNQELETFSYSISHDLRAPLRAIDGFSRMLTESLGEDINFESRHYIETLCDNVRQMNDLIDGLLQFSRLAFQPFASRKIEMKELAQHVIDDLLAVQPERHVEVSLANLPPAWGDPLFIRQVFVNLLENAFKYTRNHVSSPQKVTSPQGASSPQGETARIEVGFFPRGEKNVYFVRDNGVGFDMHYADKLFGIFQRLHSRADFEGTGVGLANVRRIILRQGGEVWAESKVDEGATFYFTLPSPVTTE
jgi:two-component system sensor histidine kinase/response regulator